MFSAIVVVVGIVIIVTASEHPHPAMLDGCVRERERERVHQERESVLIYCAVLAFTTFYGKGEGVVEEEERRLVPVVVCMCMPV